MVIICIFTWGGQSKAKDKNLQVVLTRKFIVVTSERVDLALLV